MEKILLNVRAAALSAHFAANANIATTNELIRLGFSRHAIRRLVARGLLHQVCRGVYAAGPALSDDGWRVAAVRAVGGDAHVSHSSATTSWGVDRIGAKIALPGAGIHVTATRQVTAPAQFVVPHRTEHAPTVVHLHGAATSSLARSIVDVASQRTVQQLANILHESQRLDLKIGDAVRCELARRPTLVASPTLLLALEHHVAGRRGTRSELEDLWVRCVREHPLDEPEYNAPMLVKSGWLELDSVWHDARLVVELDSKLHDRQRSKRTDGIRDLGLDDLNYRVIRLRWADLTMRRQSTMEHVERVLDSRRRMVRSEKRGMRA